jgi:hypothetical protein
MAQFVGAVNGLRNAKKLLDELAGVSSAITLSNERAISGNGSTKGLTDAAAAWSKGRTGQV